MESVLERPVPEAIEGRNEKYEKCLVVFRSIIQSVKMKELFETFGVEKWSSEADAFGAWFEREVIKGNVLDKEFEEIFGSKSKEEAIMLIGEEFSMESGGWKREVLKHPPIETFIAALSAAYDEYRTEGRLREKID